MFDFSNFHPGHNKLFCNHNGRLFIVCTDCGVAGEIEAISAKISPKDACLTNQVMETIKAIDGANYERLIIGDQSPSCNRGGAVL